MGISLTLDAIQRKRLIFKLNIDSQIEGLIGTTKSHLDLCSNVSVFEELVSLIRIAKRHHINALQQLNGSVVHIEILPSITTHGLEFPISCVPC